MIVSTAVRRAGFVWDERFCWHDGTLDLGPWVQPGALFESPEGKRRFANLVAASGLGAELVAVPAVPLEVADAVRFHDRQYLDRVMALSAADGGSAGDYCHVGRGSWEVALLAAGGTYQAVRAVLDGTVDVAYALVRPGGHHAEPGRGRGYCILANVALAVLKARAELGVRRVAVVDFDVHHGNGTQLAFWDDPDVLTVSLHQDRLYPEVGGGVDETGGSGAPGSCVNLPLPPGSGRGAYLAAFEQVVLPAVRAHRPELILVASGFDSGGLDPLGRMMLSAQAYRELTGLLLDVAAQVCDGRLVMSHEGGYSELHVPFCGLAVMEALSGARTDVEDPFAWIDDDPYQPLQDHQARVLESALAAHLAARSR